MRFASWLLRFVFILFLTFEGITTYAAHIIGGDITVRRLSPNYYEIKMTFFRDCAGGGALFDNPVYIGIYDKATHAQQQVVNMGAPTITSMTLGNGCYTPSLCMEKGIYIATNVYIPNNSNGYYLSWLRCCRNAVITNIVTPGDDGSIFYTEICDPAIVNSTPVFNSLPDGFMCRNYLNTDAGFTATDADGDQLVYDFVTPLSCSPTGQCDNSLNTTPSQATSYLPGPYGSCVWQVGYALSNPMGDPSMAVNSSTGVITGTPPNLGVYVICVRVSEYRASVKIGEIRRDFQFDVLNGCSVMNITASPGTTSCVGSTTTLTAVGAPAGYTYAWSPGGQATQSIAPTAGSAGSFVYTVTANSGACTYTATTTLLVNANPTPAVSSAGVPCLGQTTTLTASGGTSYSWSNGFLTAAMSTSAPGTYTVWVTNANGCSSSTTGTVSAAPITASTYTWTGAGSNGTNDWFDANNWSAGSGCIPTCSKNVYIPNVANDPDIGTGMGAAACKDITLATGAKITFSAVAAELDICGDVYDNGVSITGAGGMGVLKFMGTIPQNFYKSNTSGGNSFHSIILANTASPLPSLTIKEGVGYKDVILDNSGTFTFQSGILIVEGERTLTIKNTASNAISGHGATKYIYGRLRRYVTNGVSYDFPIGGNPLGTTVYPYELMNINFSSITGLTYLTACFDNPNNSTGALTGNGLPLTEQTGQYTTLIDNGGPNTGVGYPSNPGTTGGIWTVIPDAGTANYTMTLYGTNYDNSAGAGSYYSIIKRNTYSTCSPIPSWGLDGIVGANSLSGNIITASRSSMSGYSQFAIAKHTTPLPVELVLFDAACDEDKTALSWVTASEDNNNYFTIERSFTGNISDYEIIGKVPGAGNSNTLKEYTFIDNEPTGGSCFYRLSQTDYNGTTVEFSPVEINCKENSAFNLIGLLPNPASHEVNILFTSINTNPIQIYVTDMLGKEVISEQANPEKGLNKVKLDVSRLTGGVYFISLNNGTKSFIKKIVKKD